VASRLLGAALLLLASPSAWAQAAATPDAGVKAPSDKRATPPTAPPAAAAKPAKAAPKVTSLSAYEDAVNAFKYQDFDNAIKRLRALLYPRTQLNQTREWRAREYLGAALWWHDEKQAALDEFTALLVRNPQARLDPTFYPPQMIKDFANLRSNLVRLGVIRADQKPTPPKLRKLPTSPPRMLAWVPFGVGQIANDEPLKGTAFMVAEVALGATSVLLWQRNSLDRADEVAPTRQVLQVSTGVGFWLVAAWGVVDAVLEWRKLDAAARRAQRKTANTSP